jgi:hypothetical protein
MERTGERGQSPDKQPQMESEQKNNAGKKSERENAEKNLKQEKASKPSRMSKILGKLGGFMEKVVTYRDRFQPKGDYRSKLDLAGKYGVTLDNLRSDRYFAVSKISQKVENLEEKAEKLQHQSTEIEEIGDEWSDPYEQDKTEDAGEEKATRNASENSLELPMERIEALDFDLAEFFATNPPFTDNKENQNLIKSLQLGKLEEGDVQKIKRGLLLLKRSFEQTKAPDDTVKKFAKIQRDFKELYLDNKAA